jgi:hypothetical protein
MSWRMGAEEEEEEESGKRITGERRAGLRRDMEKGGVNGNSAFLISSVFI